jgi:hypothetical protein
MTPAQKRKMKTDICISDSGTFTALHHDGAALSVIHSGGCPAERILAGIDFAAAPDALEAAIRDAWSDGYDGDPSDIRIVITREN